MAALPKLAEEIARQINDDHINTFGEIEDEDGDNVGGWHQFNMAGVEWMLNMAASCLGGSARNRVCRLPESTDDGNYFTDGLRFLADFNADTCRLEELLRDNREVDLLTRTHDAADSPSVVNG